MFLRLYMWLRVMRDFSSLYRRRHQAALLHPTARQSGVMLTLRVLLAKRPVAVVVGSTLTVVFFFTYVIYVMEREAKFEGIDVSIDRVALSLWFVVATLTTVGYGDVTPSTTKAYYPAIVEGAVGMVITSLLVAVVIDSMTLRGSEEKLYEWMQTHDAQKEHRLLSKRIVEEVCRAWVQRRRLQATSPKHSAARQRVVNEAGDVNEIVNPMYAVSSSGDSRSEESARARFQITAGLFKRLIPIIKRIRHLRTSNDRGASRYLDVTMSTNKALYRHIDEQRARDEAAQRRDAKMIELLQMAVSEMDVLRRRSRKQAEALDALESAVYAVDAKLDAILSADSEIEYPVGAAGHGDGKEDETSRA